MNPTKKIMCGAIYNMDENIQDFPESPFEPWRPVSPDKFKGRKKRH